MPAPPVATLVCLTALLMTMQLAPPNPPSTFPTHVDWLMLGGAKVIFVYGLIQHGHAHTQVTKSLLIIIVQHIQSLHARDEIKLIKYATHVRDGHAPTPNYTNHHSTVVPAPTARPAHDDYEGSAVGGRVVCGRAGRWMGGWAAAGG